MLRRRKRDIETYGKIRHNECVRVRWHWPETRYLSSYRNAYMIPREQTDWVGNSRLRLRQRLILLLADICEITYFNVCPEVLLLLTATVLMQCERSSFYARQFSARNNILRRNYQNAWLVNHRGNR